MESGEHKTDIIGNHKYNKLEDVLESKTYRTGKSKRNKGHRKVEEGEFGHNGVAPQESIQNYEADEYDENGKRRIIKVEQFECSDDIVPQIAVEHCELEQSIENQTKVLVKLEQCYGKLQNLSENRIYQMEENKRNEEHRKVKVDEFGHNIRVPQESKYNFEADEYEENGKRRIIKVEKFECTDDILPQIAVDQYDQEKSIENQTKVLVKLEQCYGKLQNLSENRIYQMEENKRNEEHRKVKVDEFGHNIRVPQKSKYNFEADECEENGKRRIIKVEKFECTDDILPQIAVDQYDQEKSIENQTNVLVELEHRYDKLENLSVSENYRVKESKRNEGHSKVNVDKFGHKFGEPQESVQNHKSHQLDGNEKNMIIKVDKFECSDDILSQIAVEHCEPKQSIENQNIVLTKLEHHCNKLSHTSQISQPEKYKRREEYKDCTTTVASAVYEVSDDSNNSMKTVSKQGRRDGNLNENQSHKVLNKIYAYDNISDNYKDTVRNELSQDDDSISVSVETSKVLSPDLQCYVALDKLSYKCDICRYVTVIKELLVSHMKLHDYKQSDSISECEIQLKNQIISEKYEHKQLADKLFACNLCSYKCAQKSNLVKHQLTHSGEKPFSCKLCSYRCTQKSCLQTHQLTHSGEKPFACNLCSYKCAQKSNLVKHQLTHSGEKPFSCNLCSYMCTQKSCLQTHQLTHSGEKSFACNLCSYKCAQKSNLVKHQLTHSGEKPFSCNLCLYKSFLKSDLERHQLRHTGQKPFACNLCSYRGAFESQSQRHQLTHTREKPFACNLCSYKCAQKSHLQRHQLTHTGQKPFACNLCPYRGAFKSLLQRHQLTHTGQKPFACNLCPYRGAFKSLLQRHQLTHTGEKPFACKSCSYKSARKSNLQTHQLRHTGQKPFACNLCSYRGAFKSQLQRHQFRHTGEKQFACNLCSYKCAQKSHLQRHQLTHTGQKPFACNLCPYRGAFKSLLQRHQLTHTGEKPFACNICSYKSARKSNLQTHLLKHRGEKSFACNLCSYKSADKSYLKRHRLKHCSQQRDMMIVSKDKYSFLNLTRELSRNSCKYRYRMFKLLVSNTSKFTCRQTVNEHLYCERS